MHKDKNQSQKGNHMAYDPMGFGIQDMNQDLSALPVTFKKPGNNPAGNANLLPGFSVSPRGQIIGSSQPQGTADNSAPSAAPVSGSPQPQPQGASAPNSAQSQGQGGLITSPKNHQALQAASAMIGQALQNKPQPPNQQAPAVAPSAPPIPNKQGAVGGLAAALSNPQLASQIKFGG